MEVFTVPMPAPPPLKEVNAFVLTGAGETCLVDAGPPTEAGWAALVGGLAQIGLQPRDIDIVLITHAHWDHFGHAARLQREYGATVVVPRSQAARFLEPLNTFRTGLKLLGQLDFPQERLQEAEKAMLWVTHPIEPVRADKVVEVGETVPLCGGELVALEASGHQCGHLAFWNPAQRWVFVGDALMARITPTILMDGNAKTGWRAPVYTQMIVTMKGIQQLGAEVAYCGHGGTVANPARRAAEVAGHLRAKLERSASLFSDTPRTVYDLVMEQYPRASGLFIYTAGCEIAAHADYLVAHGRARAVGRNRFAKSFT